LKEDQLARAQEACLVSVLCRTTHSGETPMANRGQCGSLREFRLEPLRGTRNGRLAHCRERVAAPCVVFGAWRAKQDQSAHRVKTQSDGPEIAVHGQPRGSRWTPAFDSGLNFFSLMSYSGSGDCPRFLSARPRQLANGVEGVVDFEQLYAALAEHGSERRTPLGGVGEDDEARHGDSVQSTEDGSMSTEARTSRPRGSAEPGAIARAMAPAAAWRGWRVAHWSRRWKR